MSRVLDRTAALWLPLYWLQFRLFRGATAMGHEFFALARKPGGRLTLLRRWRRAASIPPAARARRRRKPSLPRGSMTAASPSARYVPADDRAKRIAVAHDHEIRTRAAPASTEARAAPRSGRRFRLRRTAAHGGGYGGAAEDQLRRLPRPAKGTREHVAERNRQRADRDADRARVCPPGVGQVALLRAILVARHLVVVLEKSVAVCRK